VKSDLKPHRDLYSIALHKLNVSQKTTLSKVIGFEDSESGTIAIRAAGIGKCIAVPFAETSGHNLDAATHICNDGST
jgi:beta-phosphoglucomutase-like phosphatase (HAD superfamily)